MSLSRSPPGDSALLAPVHVSALLVPVHIQSGIDEWVWMKPRGCVGRMARLRAHSSVEAAI